LQIATCFTWFCC